MALYRNPTTGQEINTDLYAPVTVPDLNHQGFQELKSRAENGGELFYQDLGNGQQYQKFVQRPAGWSPGTPSPASVPNPNMSGNPGDLSGTMTGGAPVGTPGNAPDLAQPPTTTPNSITSDYVTNYMNSQKSYLADEKVQTENDRTNLATQRDSLIASIKEDYAQQEEDLKKQQAAAKGTEEAILYRTGRSGSVGGMMQAQQSDLARVAAMNKLLNDKQNLILKAQTAWSQDDAKSVQAYRKLLADTDEKIYNAQQKNDTDRLNEYIQMSQEGRAVTKANQEAEMMPFDKLSKMADALSKIPQGQTVMVNGIEYEGTKEVKAIDPFFSGSDIIALMKGLNEGESKTIVDPNTGTKYTVQGIGTEKDNTVIAYDDRGFAHILDKTTGQEVAKSKTPVGKTKTQAASTTVILNQERQADLSSVLDSLNATPKGADGNYNSDVVSAEVQKYAKEQPGKVKDLLDAIAGSVNMKDTAIQQLYGKFNVKPQSTIELSNGNGSIKITK